MQKHFFLACMTFLSVLITGCAGNTETQPVTDVPRDNTPVILESFADEEVFYQTEQLALDASHTSDGYVMVKYLGENPKVKLQILAPNDIDYTYLISDTDTYHTYPLSGGSGSYHIRLLESLAVEDSKYAVVFGENLEVTIEDEFEPFLRPNYYVNFSADSSVVTTGSDLASDCYCELDVINNIYHYVTENITYDTPKAQDLAYGYTPNPDETLSTGKGICFDYASLMSAMLRSQRIPTRLEVGYVGEVYHAWISCYVDEIGWVDNIISFDGKSWSLMDPTLAANNNRSSVKEYIGDGSNYLIKYTY